MEKEKSLTEKESLDLIAMMISQAKESNHDTGTSAIMWGAIITICSLVRLAEIQFSFRLPFDIYFLTILAVVPQIVISIREKKMRRVKTYDDIYMDYVWLGFGICIMLMIFITNAVFRSWGGTALEGTTIPGFYEYVSPLFLLLYGLPTFITGAACKFRPMLIGGIFCWVCCLVTIYTTIKIDLILVALLLLFLPG
jgi:hypothetical protein